MPNVIWTPNSGSQTLFMTCPIRECLFEGSRGRGGTDALLMDFAQHCGQGFGEAWRGILFRRTFPQLEDVIARSKRWFYQIFPRGSKCEAEYNESKHFWKWSTGEMLLLSNMNTPDDYWNYHGHEYPWIGWEELTNWPDLACYDRMKACNRSSIPGMPRKMRSNCNPHGVGHGAVKEYFQIGIVPPGQVIQGEPGWERVRLHGHYSENTVLMRADPLYASSIRSAAGSDANMLKAWYDGSWDILAGGIFEGAWDSNVHVIEPFEIPRSWTLDRSHDWGGTSPFCTLWFAESNGEEAKLIDGSTKSWPRGTVFVIAEDYGWTGKANKGLNLSSPRIAQRVIETEETLQIRGRVKDGPGDGIWDVRDGRSIASEMALAGVRWTHPAKGPGSRIAGWQQIRQMLDAASQPDQEEPGLFVFNRCANLIRTVNMPRKDKDPDDVDSDCEDHAWDAARYRLSKRRVVTSSIGLEGV